MTDNPIQTKLDNPIIFRTCGKDVYESALKTGSIWLRSSHYYQRIEDEARQDSSEGMNSTTTHLPLNFSPTSAQPVSIHGPGNIGQEIVPHYIMSMHGTSVSESVRKEFGGFTLGVCSLADLAAEILYQASKQTQVTGYRYGPVAYQRTAITWSYSGYGAAMELSGNPSVYLKSINTDVLRKDPAEPFIRQDEWRIAVFPKEYITDDPNEPLKINVDPSHFYRYVEP